MFHFIFGGIHLEGRKEGTRRKPISVLEPEQVVIPVSMHTGVPCEPVVKVGDSVSVGQPIAHNEQGVLIHAGVSGRVQAIEERPYPNGKNMLSVVIANDGKQTRWPECGKETEDYECLNPDEIMERIRWGGVASMGGSGYPTVEKIQLVRRRVDTLIVNAAESEPYLTADHRLLLERGEGVLIGLALLTRAVGAKEGVIAVEGNKLNATEVLERIAKRKGLKGRICTVPSRYPLGAEKQVIKSVTGREVPPGKRAVDVGCVVFNAATAYAVYEAVVKGLPLTHRVVTVAGGALSRPRNLWVPIGTPISELIREAGGFKEAPGVVLMGGPMMGAVQADLSVPVVRTTNSVVCMLDAERGEKKEETVCIRCGQCVSACPMHLMPLLVDKELKLGGDVHELRRLHTEDCLSCGCCSYVCPAHIPLVKRMAQARQIVNKSKEVVR